MSSISRINSITHQIQAPLSQMEQGIYSIGPGSSIETVSQIANYILRINTGLPSFELPIDKDTGLDPSIALYNVGQMYLKESVPVNQAKWALDLLTLAADAGNFDAQVLLGFSYWGEAHKYDEYVLHYLKKAIAQQKTHSLSLEKRFLSSLHSHSGGGIEKDFKIAYSYLREVADAGDHDAEELIALREDFYILPV